MPHNAAEDTGYFKVGIAKAIEKLDEKIERGEEKRDTQHQQLVTKIETLGAEVNSFNLELQGVQNSIDTAKLHADDAIAHCKSDPGNPIDCPVEQKLESYIFAVRADATASEKDEQQQKRGRLRQMSLALAAISALGAVAGLVFKLVSVVIQYLETVVRG